MAAPWGRVLPARGGNIAPDADQFLCQERDKQFPIKPSAGTAVVMLGHMPQLGKALQSLKHQLNLPTHTVRSQNVRRRTAGAGRKHDHVLSQFECSQPSDHLLLTRFAASANAPVESRSRSCVLHTTGPQKTNLDHARQPAIRRTAPDLGASPMPQLGPYRCEAEERAIQSRTPEQLDEG
jgi:hypothetical protein